MPDPIPAQSIADSCYFGDSALNCLSEQYIGAFGGGGLFALVLSGVIFMTFYIASDGSTATPTVALILAGTALVGMLPGQYQQVAIYVVVIGAAAALFQVVQKYFLSPATQ